jgi:quercetin dioxygenase-like cupin family protein
MKRLIKSGVAFAIAMSLFTGSKLSAQSPMPFTYRGWLDSFKIHQLPDFMTRSSAPTELVFQRLAFAPGQGAWHVHYGISFVYVVSGQLKLQKFSSREGCTETPVYGPGQAFMEYGGEVHRAVVVGNQDAVVVLARLNAPPGAPLTVPADAPGCFAGGTPAGPPLTETTLETTPFTLRAPLAPFAIHQLPDFLMHSRQASDLIIQRSIFPPGPGGWHIHRGSSFVYVISGQIKLQKFTSKDGCVETPVYGPGQAYFEVGDEVHRAVVTSQESAVIMVVRFNTPVGAPITIAVEDPGC